MSSKTKTNAIIFDTNEVNAALAGCKTQHRVLALTSEQVSAGYKHITQLVPSEAIFCKYEGVQFTRENSVIVECPFGKVGDRLWVQEPTLAIEDVGWLGPVYVASTEGQHAIDWGYGPYDDPAHIPACDLTYNKSCDLSYEESRMLLEITDVRIERILDISDTDAKAMGLKPDYCDHKYQTCEDIGCIGKWAEPLMSHFIYQKNIASVRSNDWVWVIEFKTVQR